MATPPTSLQLELVCLTSSGSNSETGRFDLVLKSAQRRAGVPFEARFWEKKKKKNPPDLGFYNKNIKEM